MISHSNIALIASVASVVANIAVESAGAVTAPTIVKIGVAGNFSSNNDSVVPKSSNYVLNGVQLAIADNKELLKSKNIEIQIQELDYGDNKLKVIDTANFAAQSDMLAVVGYIRSSDALIAGPIFQKNKVPLLNPTATLDNLEEIGPYVRRTCFDNSYQGKIVADYAVKDRKAKNFAIITAADCAYCQSLHASFKKRVEEDGGKILVDTTVMSSDTQFEHLIGELRGKKIDGIYVPNYERVSSSIIALLYDSGIRPALWLGGDGWGGGADDLFLKIIGSRKFEGFAIAHWHKDLDLPASQAFAKAYIAKYHQDPLDVAGLVYDSMGLMIKAVTSAKTLSRDGILHSLEKVTEYRGITGKMKYRGDSRTPEKPAVLLRYGRGEPTPEKIIGG